jgi:hypothetical protein
LKSDWKTVFVGDLGRIITGKTPKTAIKENYGGIIPFLTPSDDMNIKHVISTSKTLSDIGLAEVKSCLLPPRSVCVSCIGSDLGKVVMTTQPTVTNQQINSIIPTEGVDPDFLYYSMIILGKELNYISKTSTAVPIINKSTFSKHTIILPPIDEQRAIASVLSIIDERIANNLKINNHLAVPRSATVNSPDISFGSRMSLNAPKRVDSALFACICMNIGLTACSKLARTSSLGSKISKALRTAVVMLGTAEPTFIPAKSRLRIVKYTNFATLGRVIRV